ncbi:MAG: YIP1 family protein [Candidatus Rokuibacteriota bacterium]
MTFKERMLGCARLDRATFEEVEHDPAATMPALGVVVLSSVAAGIGSGARATSIVVGILVALAAWYVWAFLTYWVGTRLLPEPQTSATHGELLRVIGFSSVPGILRVLGIVPGLRAIVFLVTSIWMLVAGVVGVRQALDYRSTGRAVAVVAIGWVVQWAVMLLFLALMAPGAH